MRKNGDVPACIWICSDINHLSKQGLAVAVYRERQLKMIFLNKSIMAQREKVLQGRCPERCFGYSLMGHQIRKSPNRRVSPGENKERGLCQRCAREKHWTNKGRSTRLPNRIPYWETNRGAHTCGKELADDGRQPTLLSLCHLILKREYLI